MEGKCQLEVLARAGIRGYGHTERRFPSKFKHDGTQYFQIDTKDTKDTKYIQVKPTGDKDYYKFDDYFHIFSKDKIKTEPVSIDEMITTLSELYAGKDKPARPIATDNNFNRLELYRIENELLLLKSAFEKASEWGEAQAKRFNPSIEYHRQRIEVFRKLCVWPENGTNQNLPEAIRSSDALLFFHPASFLSHLKKAELYGNFFEYSDLHSRLEQAVLRALDPTPGIEDDTSWAATGSYMQYLKKDNTWTTFCSWFVYDMIRDLFPEAKQAVFGSHQVSTLGNANAYYTFFETNPSLEPLKTADGWTRQKIQEEVDTKGSLIIASSFNTHEPGHVGIVGPSSMQLRSQTSIPKSRPDAAEAPHLTSFNSKDHEYPILVQAGGRNGVLPMNWAFSRVYITAYTEAYYRDGFVTDDHTIKMRFYRIRRN